MACGELGRRQHGWEDSKQVQYWAVMFAALRHVRHVPSFIAGGMHEEELRRGISLI